MDAQVVTVATTESLVLETRGLTKRFGGLVAVDGLSMAVPRGQIRGLIGPNGAGKSTLIDVLSGRTPNWSGTVRFHGDDISALTGST